MIQNKSKWKVEILHRIKKLCLSGQLPIQRKAYVQEINTANDSVKLVKRFSWPENNDSREKADKDIKRERKRFL